MGDRTIAAIPFVPDQQSGVEELAGGSPVAMNITIDSKGAITLRPGMADYAQGPKNQTASSNPILWLYAASDGNLYAVQQVGADWNLMLVKSTGMQSLSERDGSKLFHVAQQPIVAETEDRLVFTSGDRPSEMLFSVGYPQLMGLAGQPDAAAPPNGTHVVANNARVLLNDTTNTKELIQFSDLSGQSTGGYDVFNGYNQSASGFFQGIPNAEPVLALVEKSQQIFCMGRTKTQVWSPDANTIYAIEAAREIGCAAPYSVVGTDDSVVWLDHRRRFTMSDGKTLSPISDPQIQQTLNDMATVSDCYGFRFVEGNTDALVWTFPTDGRTFVYQKSAGWSQWSSFNGSQWGKFAVRSHTLRPDDDTNVVGLADGRIAKLSTNSGDDFGTAINAYIITGFQDRDTDSLKHCRTVFLAIRRGQTGSTEPCGRLSWRDDLGDFGPGMPVSFGATDDTNAVVVLRGLGTYRRRQWKFEFMTHVAVASVREEYEVLGI